VLFSSRVRVRIRFSVWLVSCYAYIFVRLQDVIVTDRMTSHSAHNRSFGRRNVTCEVESYSTMLAAVQFNQSQTSVCKRTDAHIPWVDAITCGVWLGLGMLIKTRNWFDNNRFDKKGRLNVHLSALKSLTVGWKIVLRIVVWQFDFAWLLPSDTILYYRKWLSVPVDD